MKTCVSACTCTSDTRVKDQTMRSEREEPPGILLFFFFFQELEQCEAPVLTSSSPLDARRVKLRKVIDDADRLTRLRLQS